MMLRLSSMDLDLKYYRDMGVQTELDTIIGVDNVIDSFCPVCQGVLQNCDQSKSIVTVCDLTQKEDFEYTDFKLTFNISVIATLNKIRAIFQAEDNIGQKLP